MRNSTRWTLPAALLFLFTGLRGQTPTHQAVVHNLVGMSSSLVNSVTTDAEGNLIITGWRSDSLDFGGTNYPQGTSGAIFLAKFNPQGNELWNKVAGSADQQGNHKGMSVAADGSGNIYCAGWLFGVQAATFDGTTLPQGSFGFVAKYSASGTLAWVKDFSGGVNAIAVDGNGTPFINLGDATIEKLDPANGTSIASGTGGGDLQNVGNHNIVVDAGNNVIAQWGNKITKYNNDLVEQWSTPLVKPFGSAESFRITVDGAGNTWATFYALFGTVTLGGTDYTAFPAGYVYSLSAVDGAVLNATPMGAFKIKKVYNTAMNEWLLIGDGAFNTPYVVKYDATVTAIWSVPTFGVVDMELIGPDCFVLGGGHDGSVTLDGVTYDRPNNSASDNAMASYLCAGAVGVEERPYAAEFAVYPNPTNGQLAVEGSDRGILFVYDALGAQVMTIAGSTARRTADVSGLEDGMYVVRDASGRMTRFNVTR